MHVVITPHAVAQEMNAKKPTPEKYEGGHANIMHHVMQHYTMKLGVKLFKEIGTSAENTK